MAANSFRIAVLCVLLLLVTVPFAEAQEGHERQLDGQVIHAFFAAAFGKLEPEGFVKTTQLDQDVGLGLNAPLPFRTAFHREGIPGKQRDRTRGRIPAEPV